MPAASAPRAAPATAPVTAPLQPAAPAAAQPPAGTSPATQQRLQTLKSLYDQGLITREQYDQRQREILANP
jgi:membrane carboxypeptidase/penicillin-binding protein